MVLSGDRVQLPANVATTFPSFLHLTDLRALPDGPLLPGLTNLSVSGGKRSTSAPPSRRWRNPRT